MMVRVWLRLLIAMGSVLGFGPDAIAQPIPMGATSPASSEAGSHSWVVIERRETPFLLHLPPREAGVGFEASDAGSVRPVRPLIEWPDAIAAIGDRVYLFYPAEQITEEGDSSRPVFSLRAVPSSIAGMWVDLPTGLMDSLPPLPAKGRLVRVAVAGDVLCVLERSAGHLGIWALDTGSPGAEWSPLPLPASLSDTEPAAVSLESLRGGVLLAAREDNTTTAWLGTLDPDPADLGDRTADWVRTEIRDWDTFWQARWRQGFGQEILAALPGDRSESPDTTGLDVYRLGAGEPTLIGRLNDARPGALAILPAPGRLVLVRPGAPAQDGAPDQPIGVQEVSLLTGRTLHDGPNARTIAVPLTELRMIAVVLVLMMAAVLIVIIRPNPDRAWSVPEGWVLADPGRRMIASLIDLIVTALVVAPAFGVTARQVLTLEVLIHPGAAWLSLPSVIVTGWIGMSVWEALLGLTPGKFVAGCRVRRAIPGPGVKVSLFWCLVRNAMKWLTPPVAAIALFDPEGRHRGDAAARAVVVSRPVGAAQP